MWLLDNCISEFVKSLESFEPLIEESKSIVDRFSTEFDLEIYEETFSNRAIKLLIDQIKWNFSNFSLGLAKSNVHPIILSHFKTRLIDVEISKLLKSQFTLDLNCLKTIKSSPCFESLKSSILSIFDCKTDEFDELFVKQYILMM